MMEEIPICRICLTTDVKMYNLIDTHLQKTYEEFICKPLVTKDQKCVQACYLCFARLQNCYQFKMKCLQSEQFFHQVLDDNSLKKNASVSFIENLTITHVLQLSMGGSLTTEPKKIKKEKPEVEITIKKEPEEIPEGSLQEFYVMLDENFPPIISEDIILNAGSTESRKLSERIIFEDSTGILDFNKDISDKNDEEKEIYRENCTIDKYKNYKLRKNKYKSYADESRYQCGICYKTLSSNSSLKRHIRTHSNSQKFDCLLCRKSCNCKSNLIKHIETHSKKKPYQCEICYSSYTASSSLKRHVSFVHNKKERTDFSIFTCDVCAKDFHLKGSLISHMRTHTGEKPYKCDVCNNCFSEKSTLNKHIRIHSDEKPYHCDICDKSFKRKSHLETHVLLHNGYRPYQCDICAKGFNQKVHLIDHLRAHTGEKPFSCVYCDWKFRYKSCLNRHLIRAHYFD